MAPKRSTAKEVYIRNREIGEEAEENVNETINISVWRREGERQPF